MSSFTSRNLMVEAPLLQPNAIKPPLIPAVGPWIIQITRRYSRLIEQLCVIALDTLFFSGKVSSKIPQKVTQTTLLLLSGVGLLAIPFSVHYVIKSSKDFIFSCGARHRLVMVLSAAKTVEVATNLGLVVGGFSAALAGVEGAPRFQSGLYRGMVPIGEAVLALGVILLLSFMWMDRRVIRSLAPERLEESRPHQLRIAFVGSASDISRDVRKQAAEIRLCMDKDTLQELIDKLRYSEGREAELFQVVRSNVITQQRMNFGGHLVLIIAGYILMAVEKYFTPNSLVSASINLGISSLYTLKVVVETAREVQQRKKISGIPALP